MDETIRQLAYGQTDGRLRSPREIEEDFGFGEAELVTYLDSLKHDGLIDWEWIEGIEDKYLYLTWVSGVTPYKLRMPAITDETEDQEWAANVYAIVLVRYRKEFNHREAQAWYDTCISTYRAAFLKVAEKRIVKEDPQFLGCISIDILTQ